MTTKNIFATAAVAALAFPAAAAADKPAEKPAKPAKPAKSKQITVGGVDLSGLTVTDGKLAGALTLDPTSANRAARTFLELTKAEIKGQDTVDLGTAGDAVIVKFNGLTSTDTLLPTDRVKVIGKLTGTALDIRKVTVTRGDTDTETEKAAKTESSKSSTRTSAAKQCKGKSRRKAAGEKKSAYAKCVSAAARAQNDDKPQS